MKRIPTLWMRDEHGLATPEHNPECAWVFEAQAEATVKWDGTAILIHRGICYVRLRARKGARVMGKWWHWTHPKWTGDVAEIDPPGHGWGWSVVVPGTIEHKIMPEALEVLEGGEGVVDGTWELCGPKINENPHGFTRHVLIRHGEQVVVRFPLTFDGMQQYLKGYPHEGVVWHHGDGRMAKVKRTDFGFKWPPKLDK